MMTFATREEAGRLLAAALDSIPMVEPLVLGIPRGGVVVAAAVAREIHADLDVVLARKLRAPGQPELAVGAVSEGGETSIDPVMAERVGATEAYLHRERAHQLEEIRRRRDLLRGVRPPQPVGGRTVIVVDDGLATGATMAAALRTLPMEAPHEVMVAVPVASPEALASILQVCPRVICLAAPSDFRAIGCYYDTFDQVDDARVVELLRAHAAPGEAGCALDDVPLR